MDREARGKLSQLIVICFDTMDTFGKKEEQIPNINQVFQMMLGEYNYKTVEDAFKEYMQENTVMPKPADIISLIRKPVVRSVADNLSDGQRRRLEQLRERDRA